MTTVRIAFSELFTYRADNAAVHLPLSALEIGGHVHGRLDILIAGRALPHMGYWGPGDVCLDTWLPELREVVARLDAADTASYVFDEGEQGQPAYAFQRDGISLLVSVVESQLSGAGADLQYQSVRCLWTDLRSEVHGFQQQLRETLVASAPEAGRTWWDRHSRHAGE